MQYYCGSIVNDQLVGNVPTLPCASTSAPRGPSSSSPTLENSTPRLGVVQIDTIDLANLNALRSAQHTKDVSAEWCGDKLCEQHQPSKDDPKFCQCGKLIGRTCVVECMLLKSELPIRFSSSTTSITSFHF